MTATSSSVVPSATPTPGAALLTPANHVLPSVCIVGPALSAIDQGFEVCVITDACGDVSLEAHERAIQRMVQAGAQPMTSVQYLLELQRDWARTETYAMTTGIAKQYAGAYGLGIIYAGAMFGAHEA